MKRRSILVKIILITILMTAAAMVLSTVVLFTLFRQRAMQNIEQNLNAQEPSCANELLIYESSQRLLDYWNAHGEELSIGPFPDMETMMQWLDDHAEFDKVSVERISEEEFDAMPPEQQKKFAEYCYYQIFHALTVFHLSPFELDSIQVMAPWEGESARILMKTNREIVSASLDQRQPFVPGEESFDLSAHPEAARMLQPEEIDVASGIYPTLSSEIEWFRSPIDGKYDAYIYGRIQKAGAQKGIIAISVSVDEMMRGVWSDTLKYEGWILIAVVVVLGILFLLVYRNAVHPTLQLQKEIRSYAEEKSRETLSENLSALKKKPDEFGQLACDVDEMAGEIQKHYEEVIALTAKQERLDAELDMATEIQAGQLPTVFPAFPERKEFDIYASMTPAKEVGGDFYDFFFLDEDHLALVIADVSGKGVPAALFMMISKRLIRSGLQNGLTPGKTMEQVNNQLLENNDLGFFVTVWLAVLDLKTGEGCAVNAGHEHPAFKKAGEPYHLNIYQHDMAVAFKPDTAYKEHSFILEPGDKLFVYTDGVPEAQTLNEEFFGEEQMLQALNKDPDATPQQTIENVMESIRTFVGEAEQFDDTTMMCFHYFGNAQDKT